jgi:hypothetical protein
MGNRSSGTNAFAPALTKIYRECEAHVLGKKLHTGLGNLLANPLRTGQAYNRSKVRFRIGGVAEFVRLLSESVRENKRSN